MRASLQEKIDTIKGWLAGSDGQDLWAVLTATRGPDSPSETDAMDYATRVKAYRGRRERKFNTVEIIREVSGLRGGAARSHRDDKVTLPPRKEWDHFDRHVAQAAQVLGLKVKEQA